MKSTTVAQSSASSPDMRHADRDGAPSPPVPVNSIEWLEAARQAFIRRYFIENGDDYEFSNNVYGDRP